jgi:hypothetical protein
MMGPFLEELDDPTSWPDGPGTRLHGAFLAATRRQRRRGAALDLSVKPLAGGKAVRRSVRLKL